jgi:hypothetical protein
VENSLNGVLKNVLSLNQPFVFEIPFDKEILGVSKFLSKPKQSFRLAEISTGKQLTLLGFGHESLLISNTDADLKAFA